MLYQTTNLVSIAECDAYLHEMNIELTQLNMRLNGVQSNMVNDTTHASVIPMKLAGAQTKLAARQTQLAAATDASERNELEIEINNLENQIIRLQIKQERLTGEGPVGKQLDIAKLEKKTVVINEFIAALESRKAELQSTGGAV